jgi:hypothetical protein
MRRRRKLEVSTFPFLAVLLSAMGSLILVLLAMDHKAKLAAKAKSELAARKVAEEAELLAAARRAEWEQARREQRAAWERKRDELHSRLESDKRNLEGQMAALRARLSDSAARLQAELDGLGDAERKALEEKGRLGGAAKALAERKSAVERAKVESAVQRAALEKMTADLALLEQTLRDLKAARERDRQTYSVVPYKGRRGESRRPLYIECGAGQVIFHPDRVSLSPERPDELRAEVRRRVARQKEIVQTSGGTADPTPYLMLLVRPDGIPAYYLFQSALRDMDVRYGYEFIDADWILDFPADDSPADGRPWTTIARSDGAPATGSGQAGPRAVMGLRPNGVPLAPEGPLVGGGRPGDGPTNAAGRSSPAGSAGGGGSAAGSAAGGPSSATAAVSENGTGSRAAGGPSIPRTGVHGLLPGQATGGEMPAVAGMGGPGQGVPGGSGGNGLGGSPSSGNSSSGRFSGVAGAGSGGNAGPGGGQGPALASGAAGGIGGGTGSPGTGGGSGPVGGVLFSGTGGTPLSGVGSGASGGSGGNGTNEGGSAGTGNGSGTAGGALSTGTGGMRLSGPARGAGPGGTAGTGNGFGAIGGAGAGGSTSSLPVRNGNGMGGMAGAGQGDGGSLPFGSAGSTGALPSGGGGTGLAGTSQSTATGIGSGLLTSGGNGGSGGRLVPPLLASSGGPAGGQSGGVNGIASAGAAGAAPGARNNSGYSAGSAASGTGTGGPGQGGGTPSPLAGAMPPPLLPVTEGQPAPPGTVISGSNAAAAPAPLFMPGQTPPEPTNGTQSNATTGTARVAASSAAASTGQPDGYRSRKPDVALTLPGNQAGGGGDGDSGDPLARYAPPAARAPGPRKPVALRPARLTGDRDYIIYVECREDSVVLYPAQRVFPLAEFARGGAGTALAQAVQQMIDRRQSSVPAGGMPYRPQVCFLVRPETVRAYHTAYPTLDGLPVPKVRQNLEPDDDVLAIVTGR